MTGAGQGGAASAAAFSGKKAASEGGAPAGCGARGGMPAVHGVGAQPAAVLSGGGGAMGAGSGAQVGGGAGAGVNAAGAGAVRSAGVAQASGITCQSPSNVVY